VEKVLNGYYSKTAFISQMNPVFNNLMIFVFATEICDKMPVLQGSAAFVCPLKHEDV